MEEGDYFAWLPKDVIRYWLKLSIDPTDYPSLLLTSRRFHVLTKADRNALYALIPERKFINEWVERQHRDLCDKLANRLVKRQQLEKYDELKALFHQCPKCHNWRTNTARPHDPEKCAKLLPTLREHFKLFQLRKTKVNRADQEKQQLARYLQREEMALRIRQEGLLRLQLQQAFERGYNSHLE